MSPVEPASDTAPFFSSDSETEGPEDHGGAEGQRPQEESASGLSKVRALLTVLILCYINLLNYMDRFTVAGTVHLAKPANTDLLKCLAAQENRLTGFSLLHQVFSQI